MNDATSQTAEKTAFEPQWLRDLLAQNTRLLACSDLNAALETILDAIIALHGADFGNVQLYDDESQTLEIVAQRGFDAAFLEAFRTVSATDGSACGRALRLRQPVVVPDVEVDADFEPFRGVAAAAGYRAVQSTPLISTAGQIVGVLSTHFRRPHRPSADEMRTLELYARHAAEMVLHFRKVADLRQAEARQRLLVQELNHRFKNMLTVIQVISRETAKSADSPESFADALNGRLRALDRAQNLLTRGDHESTDLQLLIGEQLLLLGKGGQVTCQGPAVRLTASEAFNIGLLLYELGTNARKYGALSTASGKVSITWTAAADLKTSPGRAGTLLDLHWVERGGPPVTMPTRSGFGSKLARYIGNAGSDTLIQYLPEGVVCRLQVGLRTA